MRLQQEEQRELVRRQRMAGKYSKVTSSNSQLAAAIPRAALNFYYDDESLMNGGLTKEQFQEQEEVQEETAVSNGNSHKQEQVPMSKHDAKMWSETHMQRLNEYEAGGDLDTSMNIGNQAYNSFRNQLDKKGYIS